MKKLIAINALLAASVVAACAQGTIAFQDATGVGGRVYLDVGTLENNTFTVELLYGPVGTPIGSLTPGVIFTSSVGDGLFYDPSFQTLNGIKAGSGSTDTTMNVEIAILGWDGNYASAAQALAAGDVVGETQEFTNPTGGGGAPAATPANLVGWTANNPLIFAVPEPSTVALGGLGAVALLVFRRRK